MDISIWQFSNNTQNQRPYGGVLKINLNGRWNKPIYKFEQLLITDPTHVDFKAPFNGLIISINFFKRKLLSVCLWAQDYMVLVKSQGKLWSMRTYKWLDMGMILLKSFKENLKYQFRFSKKENYWKF